MKLAIKALAECRADGTVSQHVGFKTLSHHRRRGPGHALEIQLEAYERDRGRRAGNSGSYGASTGWGGDGSYAATYDEWGFFLAKLFKYADEHGIEMLVGTPKNPVYYDSEHFHFLTGRTYDPTYPDYVKQQYKEYGNALDADDFAFRTGRKRIGRRGAGRIYYDDPHSRYGVADPRTAEWLRDFQSGKVF